MNDTANKLAIGLAIFLTVSAVAGYDKKKVAPVAPETKRPVPAPVPPVSEIQHPILKELICVKFDLAHANPNSGVLPCLEYAPVDEVVGYFPLPAIPVKSFNGMHSNGDFGRRL